jgi:hypothetical protein
MNRSKPLRNYRRYLGLITVLWLITFQLIPAQSSGSQYFWIEFGLGGGSVGEGGGSGCLNVNYQFGRNLCSARIIGCGELFGRTLNDYSFLYNHVFNSSALLITFGGGLGIVTGHISHGLFSDKDPEDIAPVIGLPLEARLFFRPLSFLGLGLFGFANINAEESFYGVTLSLALGKMR